MLVIRRFGMLLFLLLLCLGVGCVKPRPTTKPASTLPSIHIAPRPMFRGLVSGMSPHDVWKTVCRRWSMGRCQKLRPVGLRRKLGLTGMRPYLPDLKIYTYQGQNELRCRHYFYFRHWGLMAVRMECKADMFAQLKAVIHRYMRWFKRPHKVNLSSSPHVYQWADKGKSNWRVELYVHRRRCTALHLDLRRRWYDIATSLEPSVAHGDNTSMETWKKVPIHVKREVLTNTGHLIDRLKAMYLKSKYYRVYSTPWTPQQVGDGCKPAPVSHPWSAKMWKSLGFRPTLPTRLRYRLIPVFHYRRVGRTRARRNYRIDAQGCGFNFHVSLRKSGINWVYDPMVVREKK